MLDQPYVNYMEFPFISALLKCSNVVLSVWLLVLLVTSMLS